MCKLLLLFHEALKLQHSGIDWASLFPYWNGNCFTHSKVLIWFAEHTHYIARAMCASVGVVLKALKDILIYIFDGPFYDSTRVTPPKNLGRLNFLSEPKFCEKTCDIITVRSHDFIWDLICPNLCNTYPRRSCGSTSFCRLHFIYTK